MKRIYLAIALITMVATGVHSQSVLLEVPATMDNTIFKDSELSNGAGQYVFVGTTRVGVTKRALVQFDLDSKLPEDATIDSVSIMMVPVKVKPGSTLLRLYRVGTEWGEGSSESTDGDGKGDEAEENDATWTFAKFNTDRWIKPGGDFAFVASDTAAVSLGENSIFSSDKIVEDVEFWLENPTQNFGWILIGDETNTSTSVKFASKENSDNSVWPMLKIYYQTATSTPQTGEKQVDLRVYQGAVMSEIVISNPGDPGLCNMEIYSITGIRLYSDQFDLAIGNNSVVTDIQDPGIYVYRIIQNQKSFSGKLLITAQ